MLRVEKKFSNQARALRSAFDERFAEPRSTARSRFVWDYWHIPGQYTALRTPAQEFFPEKVFQLFLDELLDFGRQHLGCVAISPPWLSLYVEGCEQQLHADVPHGPFAFVYSLTPWEKRRFTGGETFLLRPRALDYWGAFGDQLGEPVERGQLIEEVPASFNQLLVFDPRIPHGVKQVRGVQEPREGRLVIHGWFTEPRPYIEGPLSVTKVSRRMDELLEQLSQWVEVGGDCHGLLVLDIEIAPNGTVSRVKKKTDTRIYLGRDLDLAKHDSEMLRLVRKIQFPKSSKGSSTLTIPLVFGK